MKKAAHIRAALPLVGIALLAASMVACTGRAGDGDGEGGLDNGRFGLVVLTHQDSAGTDDELVAQAWFAEHTAVAAKDVLSFLHVPLLGGPVPERADECLVTNRGLRSLPPDADGVNGWVDFVDAGRLSVDADGRALDARTKLLPDLGLGVGGVVYDARHREDRIPTRREPWLVEGEGGTEVGPFTARVEAPGALHLTGVGPEEAYGPSISWPALDEGGLDVTWEPGDGEDGVVVLRLVRHGFDRASSVVCAAADDGHFSIPVELVEELPDYGPDQADRLDVLRFTATPFEADGLDEGLVLAVARASTRLE
ncbi:MAG: hypothetical protein ACQEXJ_13920 [Myxococcota bacterium]